MFDPWKVLWSSHWFLEHGLGGGGGTETIADVLRVLDNRGAWPRVGAEWVTWGDPLAKRRTGSLLT